MRLLEKNGKIIYHSKRNLTDEGVEYFNVPVGIRGNPMPYTTDYTLASNGQLVKGVLQLLISRDSIRDMIVFNPYGYDHEIEGESSYGLDEDNPYGWVEEYMTRWINDLAEGDYFYINNIPPEDYSDYIRGQDADYMVIGIENTPNYMKVMLKRLSA